MVVDIIYYILHTNSALIDVAQMKQVLEFADIFYQKRFVMEKVNIIAILLDEIEEVIDAEKIEKTSETKVIDVVL